MNAPHIRPDVKAFLDFLNTMPGPKLHELPPAQARKLDRFLDDLGLGLAGAASQGFEFALHVGWELDRGRGDRSNGTTTVLDSRPIGRPRSQVNEPRSQRSSAATASRWPLQSR